MTERYLILEANSPDGDVLDSDRFQTLTEAKAAVAKWLPGHACVDIAKVTDSEANGRTWLYLTRHFPNGRVVPLATYDGTSPLEPGQTPVDLGFTAPAPQQSHAEDR